MARWSTASSRGFRGHSEVFVDRLTELGIPVTVEMGPGTHSWEYWDVAFERSLPMLLAALGE